MQLDIQESLDRVQHYRESELAAAIVRKIRESEAFKISLLQDVEAHPDYVVEVYTKLDTYIFQLQELEKIFSTGQLPLDQLTALSDEEVRTRMAARIDLLRRMGKA
jgi:hypothetical protein